METPSQETGISGLRVNGDIILECKYILPANCKTLDMISFFLITKKSVTLLFTVLNVFLFLFHKCENRQEKKTIM